MSIQKAASQKAILIVEDDEDIRQNLKFILEFENYRVYEARHGKEAFEVLEKHASDVALVFLDLMMPVMDGRTFLKERAKVSHLENIPIVVFTASPETVDGKVVKVLRKPVDLDDILNLAKTYCSA